jgi:hypothetical protein
MLVLELLYAAGQAIVTACLWYVPDRIGFQSLVT